jgi:predicted transcriptional regulator
MQRVPFKEIYCQDCKIILARYNEDYFSEASIDELSKLHYYFHIREGHSIIVRKKIDNSKSLSGILVLYL